MKRTIGIIYTFIIVILAAGFLLTPKEIAAQCSDRCSGPSGTRDCWSCSGAGPISGQCGYYSSYAKAAVDCPPHGGGGGGTSEPQGWHDTAVGASCLLEGWTCDADNFGTALTVHFYADGPAGSGTFAGSATANYSRPDVASSCGGNGNHGFNYTLPANNIYRDGRSHSWYVYGLGINSAGTQNGQNPLLSGSGKSMTCAVAATPTPTATPQPTREPTPGSATEPPTPTTVEPTRDSATPTPTQVPFVCQRTFIATVSGTPTPTPTETLSPTPTACENCQYQTELFWGPVIKSFAGGVLYGDRKIKTASDFSYPGCDLVTVTPSPVVVPTLPAGCENPTGSNGYLTGSLDTSKAALPDGYIKGTITNTTSSCTYDVGLASYKASGTASNPNIENQNLFDFQTGTVGPGQTVTFYVNAPMNNDAPACHVIPSETPTPTSPPSECESFAVHEHSGSGTKFVKYQLDPNPSVTALSDFCPRCDVESMDDDPTTGVVYAIPNDEKKDGARLCILNKETGALESCVNTDDRIVGLSFRPSDKTLWAWKDGDGLITIDKDNGTQSEQILGSSLDIQGIAWDKDGNFLYAAKDNGDGKNADLYRYDPSSGSFNFVASLTVDQKSTDAIDFSPDGWLVGSHKYSGGVKIFAFDVGANKLNDKSWTINTDLNNMDAFTAMCPLNIGTAHAQAQTGFAALSNLPPVTPVNFQPVRVNIDHLSSDYYISVTAKTLGSATFSECFREKADTSPIGAEASLRYCSNLIPGQSYVFAAVGLNCTNGTCFPTGAKVETAPTVPSTSTVVLNIDLSQAGTLSPPPSVQTGKINGSINVTANGVAYTSVGSWLCEVDSQGQQIKETCQTKWIKDVGLGNASTEDIKDLLYDFDGLPFEKKYEVGIGVYDFSGNIAKPVGISQASVDCPSSGAIASAQGIFCPVSVGEVQNFNITLSEAGGTLDISPPPGINNQEFAEQIACYAQGTCSALDVSKWISEIACHVPGLQQQTCDPTKGECQMLFVPPCLYKNVSL